MEEEIDLRQSAVFLAVSVYSGAIYLLQRAFSSHPILKEVARVIRR